MSTPCPSGDQTIWEIPSRSHSGITSASGPRHSIEYCGWLDTHLAVLGSASEASIFSTGHSLKPMWRALPACTTSVSAAIVSSSGVSSS